MKRGVRGLVLVCAVLFSGFTIAQGCAQQQNVVGFVGMDGVSGGKGQIFVTVSGHNNDCGYDYFRFRAANTDVDQALSILLAAKMANKKVRIDLIDKADRNTAYRVYIH